MDKKQYCEIFFLPKIAFGQRKSVFFEPEVWNIFAYEVFYRCPISDS